MTDPATTYAFSDVPDHGTMADHLSATLDAFARQRLAPHIRPGTRFLEIGAGSGLVSRWAHSRGAVVVATDTQPEQITAPVSAVRHDIVEETLADLDDRAGVRVCGKTDVIYSRLVLGHLPERDEIIRRLADQVLAPGGLFVIEQFDVGSSDRCVLDAPDQDRAQRLLDAYHRALVARMAASGTDVAWARQVHRTMASAGLVEVEVEVGGARSWRGGEPGCLLPWEMIGQLRTQLLDGGMEEADLDALRELLLDPRLMILNGLMVSTSGRKPA